jgi:DNA-binding helix-hairpin-helix protein with protein kinase domain
MDLDLDDRMLHELSLSPATDQEHAKSEEMSKQALQAARAQLQAMLAVPIEMLLQDKQGYVRKGASKGVVSGSSVSLPGTAGKGGVMAGVTGTAANNNTNTNKRVGKKKAQLLAMKAQAAQDWRKRKNGFFVYTPPN